MNLEMFVTWIVIGLLTGWLLGFVLKHGGYGRISDTAGAAFVGAALITVLQRKIAVAYAPERAHDGRLNAEISR